MFRIYIRNGINYVYLGVYMYEHANNFLGTSSIMNLNIYIVCVRVTRAHASAPECMCICFRI